MKHLTEEQINEMVDETLSPHARAELEQHSSECMNCRAEIAAMRSMAVRVRGLPLSIQPPADVWPMVSAKIQTSAAPGEKKHKAFTFRAPEWGWPAAAAVLLVMISSAVTTLVMGRQQSGAPTVATSRPSIADGNLATLSRREASYRNTADELWAAVNARRDQLSPQTIATVERSVMLIDAAILEAREALASDPNNAVIADMLSARYERKVDLLKRATELLPQS